MSDLRRAFLDRSRAYLRDGYLPRIRLAVARLSPEDLWWRPNEASNSVGNLLLHLAGNLRQWIVAGVGGAPDVRVRNEEFAAAGGPGAAELLDRLGAAVMEADATLARLDPGALDRALEIQGHRVTAFEAVYHAVEHFAMHTGQITYVAKLRAGTDLGFYRVEGGVARAAWEGAGGI